MTPPVTDRKLEDLCVQTLRMLAVDGVEKAKSGHPGMPMGTADLAYILWGEYLRFDPAAPKWPDRDRFVLSAGHGSMLLYSLLHLFGYDLPKDELKRFRQWGSLTPGHPEYGHTVGVETTTGPLGQGFAHGVGMAMASRMLGARFNQPDFAPFTHRVFGIVSDGDLMEGLSQEAASLAGRWGLGNLIYLYDSNHISIEGATELAFCEDVGARLTATGWHIQHVDGYDRPAIRAALDAAIAVQDRPSMVIARTHIGYGSPKKQDTRNAHGEPLGAEELKATKEALGWPLEPTFLVPGEAHTVFAMRAAQGRVAREQWEREFAAWKGRHPELAAQCDAHLELRVPADLDERLAAGMDVEAATRQHSRTVIQKIAAEVPSFVGGSADLEPSTLTWIEGAEAAGIEEDVPRYSGRNFRFGIREHGMAAAVNGLALSGAFLPFGAGFLIFTDYARPSIRLSALMGVRSTWVFTHDSIFLGEDGPTHQPIEQIPSLRAMPGLNVWRPADGLETAMAWAWCVMQPGKPGPNLLALTRQKLPVLKRPEGFARRDVWRGGYVVRRERGKAADVVLLATGSEVGLAVAAAELLAGKVDARVVSLPCLERFAEQDAAWRDSVIPPGTRRVSLEAAATFGWHALTGSDGLCIGLDRFGASAPIADLLKHFGFTPEAVAEKIRAFLES